MSCCCSCPLIICLLLLLLLLLLFLPLILLLLLFLRLYSFRVHETRTSYVQSKDMNQYAAVDLLNLTSNALVSSRVLYHSMASGDYAVQLCKAYKDPFMLWVIKAAAERATLMREGERKGWDPLRMEMEEDRMRRRQQGEEVQMQGGGIVKAYMGGLVWYFLRFANIFVQVRLRRGHCVD